MPCISLYKGLLLVTSRCLASTILLIFLADLSRCSSIEDNSLCKVISHEVRKGMQKWAHPIQESNPLFHLQFQIVFGSPLGHQFCCMVSREALIGLPCVSSDNSEAPITFEQVPCWLLAWHDKTSCLELVWHLSQVIFTNNVHSYSSLFRLGMGIVTRKEEIIESLTSKVISFVSISIAVQKFTFDSP